MKTNLTVVLAFAFVAPLTSLAHPQTERYIPIGHSPGQAISVIGEITAASEAYVTVKGKSIVVSRSTPVWIDGSKQGSAGSVGDQHDCTPGRFVEIRYRVIDGESVAYWIKVRAE